MEPTKEKKLSKKQRRILLVSAVLLLAVLVLVIFFLFRGGSLLSSAPAVTVETPGKMSHTERESFSLALELSALAEADYPAASFSISFDPEKLEFLGLDEGNVSVKNPGSRSGAALPEWSVNVDKSNETGQINIMYLDMTGGKYAFLKELLQEEDNVLLYLKFRLRGSVKQGDVYELCIDDAVFAASDESESLAKAAGSLRTNNGRIVIGG